MKVVLIGFMGSGKTTIAEKIAENLGIKFIDMDELTLKKSGRLSINEIFEIDGEKKFREIEFQVARDMTDQKAVISTGGGVVMNKAIMNFLKKNATVVYLKKSFDKIKEHVALKKITPPLFQNDFAAKKLFEIRAPLYEHYANIVVRADNKDVAQIVKEIMEALNGRK